MFSLGISKLQPLYIYEIDRIREIIFIVELYDLSKYITLHSVTLILISTLIHKLNRFVTTIHDLLIYFFLFTFK